MRVYVAILDEEGEKISTLGPFEVAGMRNSDFVAEVEALTAAIEELGE